MTKRNVNNEPPDWHLKYHEDREKAVADGDDSFITLDAFEEDLRNEMNLVIV